MPGVSKVLMFTFALLAMVSLMKAQEINEEINVEVGPDGAVVRPKRQFIAGLATGAAIEHHHHNHHGGHYNSYPGYYYPAYPSYPSYGSGYNNYYG